MLVRYPSVDAYMDQVKANWKPYPHYPGPDANWNGGLTMDESLYRAVHGDLSLVSAATDAIEKVLASQVAPAKRNRYVPSCVGTRVSVPDYLGGNPCSMRRKRPTEIHCQSARIFVSVSSSAGISSKGLLTRGQTILALLEYLQMCSVAIELYLLCELDGKDDGDTIQVIKVESNPLDLSTAGFAIAHPAFARNVAYSHAHSINGYMGGWPRGFSGWGSNNKDYYERLSKMLAFEKGDIHVRIPVMGDNEDIIKSPETWLTKHISQLGFTT